MSLNSFGSSRGVVQQGVVYDANQLTNMVQMNFTPVLNMSYLMPINEPMRQQQTLEALIGSTVPNLDWPPLPRIWSRFDHYEIVTSTVNLGFQWWWNKIGFSTKTSYTIRYNKNVSFVLISSLRSKKNPQVATLRNNLSELPSLTIEDPISGIIYPNGAEGYPMVGLCLYDLSMATENTQYFLLDLIGSGASREKISGYATPYTLYSNFFQIEPNKPIVSHYVTKICEETFQKNVKNWIEEQFAKSQRALRTEIYSECLRASDNSDRTEYGDASCLEKHKTYPKEIQDQTVSRCERLEDDLFHCILKTKKEGMNCPFDRKQDIDGTYIYYPALNSSKEFDPFPSYPCDEGLTCKPIIDIHHLQKPSNLLNMMPSSLDYFGTCQKAIE